MRAGDYERSPESGILLPRRRGVLHARPQWMCGPGFFGGSGAAPSGQTWNPADKSANITLSAGNLVATRGAAAAAYAAVRAVSPVSGKKYWEIAITVSDAILVPGDFQIIGVMAATSTLSSYVGSDSGGWGYAIREGALYTSGSTPISPGGLPTAVQGDVIMFAVNSATNTLWIGKNGTWFGSNPSTGAGSQTTSLPAVPYPATSLYRSTYANTAAFSSGNIYTIPTGFSMF